MPLSENEERILAEIERRLAEEDPRFVERARRASRTDPRGRRLRWSVVGFLVGFATIFALTFNLLFGFVGFALMLVSVVAGVRSLTGDAEGPMGALANRIRRLIGRHDHAS